MPTDAAGDGPRPPGRRSIHLYGPPSAGIASRATGLPVAAAATSHGGGHVSPKSAIIAGVPGVGPLHSTANAGMHHSYAASAASLMNSQSFPSVSAAQQQQHQQQRVPGISARASEAMHTGDAITASPRHLRGRLNEGTVHRFPYTAAAAAKEGKGEGNASSAADSRGNGGTARSQPTVRITSLPLQSITTTATSATATTTPGNGAAQRGRGPQYGPSVVSWVHVSADERGLLGTPTMTTTATNAAAAAATTTHAEGNNSSSPLMSHATRADTAAAAVTQMVHDASVRNTWAMQFPNTATLRETVGTDHDAFTHFEGALVEELNALRRAPADYAAVVEREATVGAPYVREDDTYFASEAAAEEAGVLLRRQAEQDAAQEVAAAAAVATAGSTAPSTARQGNASSAASSVAPKTPSTAHGIPSTNAAAAPLALPPSATSFASTAPASLPGSERKKGKKSNGNVSTGSGANVNANASLLSGVLPPVQVLQHPLPNTSQSSAGAATKVGPESARQSPRQPPHVSKLPSPFPAAGAQELTLAELRHCFRCQQRYRAALEAGVRELRAAQRHAETAQLAAWAAEDEKSQKRLRRSTASSMANTTTSASNSPGYSVATAGNASAMSKKLSTASSARRGSPAMDENIFLRRSEEAAQVHRAYEQRVRQLEAELQRARSACQRSLAGGNLISSAVRALREARPAPALELSRGLGLAARDTADVYYGDEQRVSALGGLYALARTTLFALSDVSSAPAAGPGSPLSPVPVAGTGSTAPGSPSQAAKGSGAACTLERLAALYEQQQEQQQAVSATSTTTTESRAVPIASVLPVLSEEATVFAHVAQKACATYGYVSNEVRGVHLQGIGTPRSLLLQYIVGCLTPVVDITHRPCSTSTTTTITTGTSTTSTATTPITVGVMKGKASERQDGVAALTAGDDDTATQCYAGMRLEGKVYAAAAGAAAPATSTTDTSAAGESASDVEAAYARVFGAGSNVTNSALVKGRRLKHSSRSTSSSGGASTSVRGAGSVVGSGGSGSGGGGGEKGRGAASSEDSAQRLWPLLWAGASSVGCGWQQVRGWRHVPNYTEACQKLKAEEEEEKNFSPMTGQASALALAATGGTPAVICSTLLLASGFEEYEMVRACSGMTPAATRRAVLDSTAPLSVTHNGSSNTYHSNKNGAAGVADAFAAQQQQQPPPRGDPQGRRAAVEVHSLLGVTLLTPIMHPIVIPPPPGPTAHAAGSGVVCVAVRVPDAHYGDDFDGDDYASSRRDRGNAASGAGIKNNKFHNSNNNSVSHSHNSAYDWLKACGDTSAFPPSLSGSVRVAVQVTRQSDPTPLWPSVDATEVLIQRSPADPSVWLILVDTNAAFARFAPVKRAEGGKAGFVTDASATVPLAVHLYAKDMRDVTGGYEHVAFIRLQQGSSTYGTQRHIDQSRADWPLMAPEWRYLLKGLSCVPTPPADQQTAASAARMGSDLTAGQTCIDSGWAVLREPLMGRDGVVLHPLRINFRPIGGSDAEDAAVSNIANLYSMTHCMKNNHTTSTNSKNPLSGAQDGPSASRAMASSGDDTIHVAIQLPAHANALWWGRRLATLRALRDRLEADTALEEEGEDEDGKVKEVASDIIVARSSPMLSEDGAGRVGVVSSAPTAAAVAASREQETQALQAGEAETAAPGSAENGAAGQPLTPAPPAPSPPSTAKAASPVNASRKKSPGGGNGSRATTSSKTAAKEKKAASADSAEGSAADAKGGKTPTRPNTHATSTPTPPGKGGSFSGLPASPGGGGRRTQSFYATLRIPESAALREYEQLMTAHAPPPPPLRPLTAAAAASANAIGVPACLQPSRVSLRALRRLHERLSADAQEWQAHLARMQPFLATERERIAAEANKRKGKEQQRLQHDQDDVAREMAEMTARVDTFQAAVTTTYEALRRRERAQVLRRAQLARVKAELAQHEAAITTAGKGEVEFSSQFPMPQLALCLFNASAQVAGSGRNVAAAAAAASATTRAQGVQPALPDVLNLTTPNAESEAAAVAFPVEDEVLTAAAENVVVLQPQRDAMSTSTTAPVVYAASCTVPRTLTGRAALLIDGEVAVTWTV